MKIRLKMTNGVLNVDAKVKNEFKQHVLKDSAIQQGLDLDVIMQYVLYGAVDNALCSTTHLLHCNNLLHLPLAKNIHHT